jgi:hypothetical protein
MPKIRPFKGEQLPIDELLPEAPTVPYKPVKRPYKIEALYKAKKPAS